MRRSKTTAIITATAVAATTAVAKPTAPPFSSINASHPETALTNSYFALDPELSAFLENPPEPITVFLPTDQTYTQKYYQPLVLNDPEYNKATLQYVIAKGIHTTEPLRKKGTSFLRTFLTNPKYSEVSHGQVLEVVSDDQGLHTFSGIRDKANLTGTEIPFRNGVAYILDRLLVTPINVSITGTIMNYTALTDITLPTTIPQLDVQTAPDMTIFAPSNEALGKYKQEHNGAPPPPEAYQGLVFAGRRPRYSTTIKKETQLKAVNGRVVTVTQTEGTLTLGGAKVIQPDILVRNGVVHIIDQ
ncbi:MAG: hypothetical protein M1817_006275 [Caeruleum heppii]|nr:MAG: hypothetical protein M1817_006275 [Caeruleum heppii]